MDNVCAWAVDDWDPPAKFGVSVFNGYMLSGHSGESLKKQTFSLLVIVH